MDILTESINIAVDLKHKDFREEILGALFMMVDILSDHPFMMMSLLDTP